MAKGIIVVDAPGRCIECQFCKNYIRVPHSFGKETTHEIHCACLNNKALKEIPQNGKPDWCPIIPMPEKANHKNYCDNGRYDKGWNDCLNELLGMGK